MSQHSNTSKNSPLEQAMNDIGLTEAQKAEVRSNLSKAESFYSRHREEIKGAAILVGVVVGFKVLKRRRLGKIAAKDVAKAAGNLGAQGEKTLNQLINEGFNVFTMPNENFDAMFTDWAPFFYNTSKGRVMVQGLPNFDKLGS